MAVSPCSSCLTPLTASELSLCSRCRERTAGITSAPVLIAQPLVPPPDDNWRPIASSGPADPPLSADERPFFARRLAVLAMLLLLLLSGALWFGLAGRYEDRAEAEDLSLAWFDTSREREMEEIIRNRERHNSAPVPPLPALPPPQKTSINPADDPRVKAEREKRQRYQENLRQAAQALQKKDFQRAAALFEQAARIERTPAVIKGAEQAQAGIAAQRTEEERRRQAAQAERRRIFSEHLARARAALDKKQFADAITAFVEAQELFPADAEARNGLDKARQGQQHLVKAEEEKKRQLLAKRQAEEEARQRAAAFDAALNAGRLALARQDFKKALDSFTAADKMRPGDPAAQDGLRRTHDAMRFALVREREEAPLRQERAKKMRFQKLLAAAQEAMVRGQYERAREDFTRAAAIFPGDADARAGVRQANLRVEEERSRNELKRRQEEKAEALRRERERDELRKKAEADLRKKKELFLRELERQRLEEQKEELRKAQKQEEQKKVLAKKLEEQKRLDAKKIEDQKRVEALVAKHLAAGRSALKARKLPQAAAAFKEAKKLAPEHPMVVQALRELERARRDLNQEAFDPLLLDKQEKQKQP